MKHNIDEIFKKSEHENNLDIRPELWHRLERRLDEDDTPKISPLRPWLVAASLALVFSLAALLYLNIDHYVVEDMIMTIEPNFSKEEVADLEKVYWIPQRIFVNPEVI